MTKVALIFSVFCVLSVIVKSKDLSNQRNFILYIPDDGSTSPDIYSIPSKRQDASCGPYYPELCVPLPPETTDASKEKRYPVWSTKNSIIPPPSLLHYEHMKKMENKNLHNNELGIFGLI